MAWTFQTRLNDALSGELTRRGLSANQKVVAGLVRSGAWVDSRSVTGETALMLLVNDDGGYGTCEFLLAKGADVNARSLQGWTPLMIAVLNRSPKCVRLLLQHGADPHAKTVDGRSVERLATTGPFLNEEIVGLVSGSRDGGRE
jgi:ankyrin repeat protein